MLLRHQGMLSEMCKFYAASVADGTLVLKIDDDMLCSLRPAASRDERTHSRHVVPVQRLKSSTLDDVSVLAGLTT
jgi:hypothetical protein